MSSCKSSHIYDVHQHKIVHKKSNKPVYAAIKKAGRSLGWRITSIKPGMARGKLYVRKHVAVVSIYYNSHSYSIRYAYSKNLKYNAQKKTIHKAYNGWIKNLERKIDALL
jgi:hypothetical protein